MSEHQLGYYENVFRNTGPMESPKRIKLLPLTEISDFAKTRLEGLWGLNEKLVNELRILTSKFRYDLCFEKIERLTRKPAELYSKTNNGITEEYINIPSYYDVTGRMYGQCGDISRQWIKKINESGLLKKINDNLKIKDRVKIVAGQYSGLSKTHFCKGSANHIWNGLSYIYLDGFINMGTVFFDAAFQKIMIESESGYSIREGLVNVKSWEDSENLEIKIGQINFSGNNCNAILGDRAVIGVSSDYKYSYSFGFVKGEKNSKDILPVLQRIKENGEEDTFVYNHNNEIVFSPKFIDKNESREAFMLIDSIKKIKIIRSFPTVKVVRWSLK